MRDEVQTKEETSAKLFSNDKGNTLNTDEYRGTDVCIILIVDDHKFRFGTN